LRRGENSIQLSTEVAKNGLFDRRKKKITISIKKKKRNMSSEGSELTRKHKNHNNDESRRNQKEGKVLSKNSLCAGQVKGKPQLCSKWRSSQNFWAEGGYDNSRARVKKLPITSYEKQQDEQGKNLTGQAKYEYNQGGRALYGASSFILGSVQ